MSMESYSKHNCFWQFSFLSLSLLYLIDHIQCLVILNIFLQYILLLLLNLFNVRYLLKTLSSLKMTSSRFNWTSPQNLRLKYSKDYFGKWRLLKRKYESLMELVANGFAPAVFQAQCTFVRSLCIPSAFCSHNIHFTAHRFEQGGKISFL